MWVKQNLDTVHSKGKIVNGFKYFVNQEKYLRTFLENDELPMDNNSPEQSIQEFCVSVKRRFPGQKSYQRIVESSLILKLLLVRV